MRSKVKRVVAIDVARKKIGEAFDVLCKTNYVLQHPKDGMDDCEILTNFTEHLDAFLRKTFYDFDTKDEDEKEFFRLIEASKNLIVLMSDRSRDKMLV